MHVKQVALASHCYRCPSPKTRHRTRFRTTHKGSHNGRKCAAPDVGVDIAQAMLDDERQVLDESSDVDAATSASTASKRRRVLEALVLGHVAHGPIFQVSSRKDKGKNKGKSYCILI